MAQPLLVGSEAVFAALRHETGGRINVVLFCELDVRVSSVDLERALDSLRALHPLLTHRTAVGKGRLRLEPTSEPIPCRATDAPITETIDTCINHDFGITAPLSIVHHRSDEVASYIVLTCDHTIIDTKGGLLVLKDLMRLLLEGPRSVPSTADIGSDTCAWLPPTSRHDRRASVAHAREQLLFIRAKTRHFEAGHRSSPNPVHLAHASIDADLTHRLVVACRGRPRKATITGLTGAALYHAIKAHVTGSGNIKCVTVVDMRPHVSSQFVEAAQTSHRPCISSLSMMISDTSDLWTDAEDFSVHAHDRIARNHHVLTMRTLGWASRVLTPLRLSTTVKQAFSTSAMLSNVGLVEPIPGVRRFHFVTSTADIDPGSIMVTATTYAERLHLSIAGVRGVADVAGLLATMVALLRGAISS